VARGILDRQAEHDSRLGEFLVRLGLIDDAELRAMRSLQAELCAANGSGIGNRVRNVVAQRFRLGRLLIDSGVIDETTLNDALARSRSTGRLLGESLVEAGAISKQALDRILVRQRHLTKVAVASAALSALAPSPAAAGDTTRLNIVATVLARASIESQRLPRDVPVTQQDIERGYVDLDPVEIGVRSNHPNGVRLGFTANSAQLSAVDIDGGGSSLLLVQQARGLQRQTVSVRLRLKLAPGAVPGNIAFPVSVFLTPA
jgi:hypothetical protein